LLPALRYIHNKENKAPRMLYVTGHSMGGGLATLFVKAMISKTEGSFGQPRFLGAKLASWPWDRIKLIAFSAPIVMDADTTIFLNSVHDNNKFTFAPSQPLEYIRVHKVSVKEKEKKKNLYCADFGDKTASTEALSNLLSPSLFRVLHPNDPVGWEFPSR
jgi:hypothetical protein